MIILGKDYKDKDFISEMAERILEYYTPDTIICCIGTPRVLADCLGPFVGSILKESGISNMIIGTMGDPLNALNIKEKTSELKRLYPDRTILSIDAAIGNHEDIGQVKFKIGGIKPGAGMGKKLGILGDISMIGITLPYEYHVTAEKSLISLGVNLSFVYNMAQSIANAIIKANLIMQARVSEAQA